MAEIKRESNPLLLTANLEIAVHGDIMIQISSSKGLANIRVASQVLCTTSPVFRAMLGPSSPFREAHELREGKSSSEPYRLTLKDDNPDALGVILLALHCQNDRVPQELSFENIVDLAIICDKYDCAAGVSQWVGTWVNRWKVWIKKAGYEKWLFIAWTFKIHDVFEQVSKKFILEGHYPTTHFRGFRTKEGTSFDSLLVPESVMKIHKRRSECIKSISETTYSCRERYWTSWGKSICKAPTPKKSCDAIILGSLMKEFLSLGISNGFDRLALKSIKDIYTGLKNLRVEFLPAEPCRCGRKDSPCQSSFCAPKTYHDHKSGCDPLPELQAKISKIYNEIKGLNLDDFKSPGAKTATARWKYLFTYR